MLCCQSCSVTSSSEPQRTAQLSLGIAGMTSMPGPLHCALGTISSSFWSVSLGRVAQTRSAAEGGVSGTLKATKHKPGDKRTQQLPLLVLLSPLDIKTNRPLISSPSTVHVFLPLVTYSCSWPFALLSTYCSVQS